MIIRKTNQGISAQRDKYLNTISTMMMEYILVFSICKDMIVRRQEIMTYLQQHLDHLELTTIELQDRKFTMSIKSRERLEYQIQKLIRSKGLQIGFISGERIG
ncbi:hypothetical protein MUK51_12155 [Sphingobacterium faecium]|uniref:hypothetical protein n=1 Tax=Sphingobacterium faecium TaxID=34087 RepID=UPI0021B53793|nr:hypothetical protein [Sphingobacterium faecium]UXD67975.1 hypothetical protein MUK51_12155 [Sphingobacterium faecium]